MSLSPLLQAHLDRVEALGTPEGLNVVAFSGGVDSSLVAWLVRRVFGDGALACLGLSAALPAAQRAQAEQIAAFIGIAFEQVPTEEGALPGYVANAGQACFYCKTTLYTTLDSVCTQMQARHGGDGRVVLFNGTNLDDRADPTRVGLKAAADHDVRSPIDDLTKAQVRELAREVGLPNWGHAASPCLRSRLQYGVEATPERLIRVERAEAIVRSLLGLGPADNLRVRTLEGELGLIEVDALHVPAAQMHMPALKASFRVLGFEQVQLRMFRSGSLSRPAD